MDEKVYYKIGEVSQRVGVACHTLRYWEREFSFLKTTRRNSRGQRIYTDEDIRKIEQLKGLLYQEGYRLTGAKRQLRGNPGRPSQKTKPQPNKSLLAGLRQLQRILDRMEKT